MTPFMKSIWGSVYMTGAAPIFKVGVINAKHSVWNMQGSSNYERSKHSVADYFIPTTMHTCHVGSGW